MIELKNIQVKYNNFIALDDINLTINKGEFFTLLGPSGSGKTTTLRSIVGFLKPASGTISIDGEIINDKDVEQREIGLVFQSYALFPTMTVYENIAFGLKIQKKSKQEIDKRVRELAKMVDFSDEQLHKNVADLSGGQQQRVAITRALAKNPPILAMDEPLSNLDAKLRKQLRAELKKIQKETGVTVVYVTHDQEEALTLSDRIAVFSNGRLEQVGTPSEFYHHPVSEYVCNFIGDSNKLPKALIETHFPNIDTSMYAHFYIRQEKIRTRAHQGEILKENEMLLTFVNDEFYGTHTNYKFVYPDLDTEIVSFERAGMDAIYAVGEQVVITIEEKDILKYKEGECDES